MKKNISFFLLFKLAISPLICVCLTGCYNQPYNVKEPITNFTRQAEIKTPGNNITCEISRSAQGISEITFKSPQELDGMKFKWAGNNYSISYKDLICETETPYLPNNSFAMCIVNALNEISKPESLTFITSQKNFNIYSGNSDSGQFQVTIDSQTGNITDLSFENENNLKIHFTN